jgi:hypothetical protein
MDLKYPIAIKYTNFFSLKGLRKDTNIGIFGMQTYHLATLREIGHTYNNFWRKNLSYDISYNWF